MQEQKPNEIKKSGDRTMLTRTLKEISAQIH